MHPEHPRDWAQTYARRKAATRELLAAEKADAFLVTHLPHIRYLTGFSGSTAYLILHRQSEPVLITDFRYREQAHEEITLTQAATVTIVEKEYLATLASVIADLKIRALAFDPKYLTCDLFAKIKRSNAEIKLDPVDNACDGLLRRKDEWEIDRISRASDIADQLFERMLKWPLTELREQDIAARLDYEGRLLESEGASFPSIIAAGSNAAKPHAPTGARKPRTGEMLLFDYGQRWAGYCSDMTRTISLGKADSKLTEIYALVRKAQEQALAVVGPGKTCAEVDEAARSVIRQAGYGDCFGHGLGHGIGIEVHESPRVSSTSTDVLIPGTVISIEPGIYIPNWGGVRIEDLIAITQDGFRNLMKSPKHLIEWMGE